MKSKLLKILLPAAFWLFVWQLLSILVGNSFLLPSIGDTMRSLITLLSSFTFYKAVLLSAIRVILGLALGCILGFILAFVCNRSAIASVLFSPIITVIKSTPVASFIVVLWVMMSGDALSVFIGFLMVMPIIWQNVTDGFLAIDKSLGEVADVFEFSRKKRLLLLVFPTLKRYLIPAVITASGLAWKAEIAAEIIAYTKNSIGQGINDAKYNLDTPTVFAWTFVIIIFSICLELVTKRLIRRTK